MDNKFTEARYAIEQARDALRRNDRGKARRFAEHAASLMPQSEDPWLILAAVASPQTSINYLKKALELNPNSPRARKAMGWAMTRLQESPDGGRNSSDNGEQANGPGRSGKVKTKRRSPVYSILLFALGCIVLAFAAWSAGTSPVLASIMSLAPQQTSDPVHHPQSWARVEIAKPTYTPAALSVDMVVALEPSATSFAQAPVLELPTAEGAAQPTAISTVEPVVEINTPGPTNTPGVMYAEIVADTPTPEYAASTDDPFAPAAPQAVSYEGEHWIDVDLSQQRVYAYAGDTVVNSFVVSTGTWQTPTPTGKYRIWIKMLYSDMSGPGYYLPDVPYVMYFYGDYGLHGTYWHNNFGTPMSHGCVNLSIPDAAWLYDFSREGTVVNVHY
jgi:lipoprotein-anchoring transpeptidase ErfK/SrfK